MRRRDSVTSSVARSSVDGSFQGQRDTFAALAGIGVGSIALIVLVPVFIVIGLFIGEAIVHLCLMIVGGANKSLRLPFAFCHFSKARPAPCKSFRSVAD